MATKYVLITGASKGIGRATALHLAKHGFEVFAGVRNPADGEALKREAPERLTPIILDVTKQEQILDAAKAVAKIVGNVGLYGLVNNAGMAASAPLEFIPMDDFRSQIEINLTGQVAVTQAFLPLIRMAKGRIVNISSIGGRIATSMLGAYNASKFALEAITDVLRQELKPWGIEVISIEPGAIATPIWESGVATADAMAARMSPKAGEYYQAQIAKSRAWAANAAQNGLPPEKAAEVIARALTAARPKTRYCVGRDAQIGTAIIARLPDRLRDRLMAGR
jgi:NAD(P)-dependent dehydrogenase (short-subunit alcohol dehydrogenase family)